MAAVSIGFALLRGVIVWRRQKRHVGLGETDAGQEREKLHFNRGQVYTSGNRKSTFSSFLKHQAIPRPALG